MPPGQFCLQYGAQDADFLTLTRDLHWQWGCEDEFCELLGQVWAKARRSKCGAWKAFSLVQGALCHGRGASESDEFSPAA